MSNRSRKVKVWVRTRPTSNFAHDMIDLQQDGKTINIHCKRDAKKGVVNNQILDWSFKLDGIMHNVSQDSLYDTASRDIVSSALDGYNGTLLCYGQTGAGKTFTMTGATENYKHRGLIPRALAQLYQEIEQRPESAISVRISYLEIYNESMFDLLSTLPDNLSAASVNPMAVVEDEHGVYVKGLSCQLAQNEEEALNLLFEGETNRAISSHILNAQSSRSHCIFTIYIESRSRVQSEAKYTISKINFVDLAGSERLGKTKSAGKTQTEAMYINKSLSFLEQTVIALADKRREHVPFRQTKLTHYLKDSIGGSCNTLLIANIWGEAEQLEETISTLRFATRMMCVASEPAVNEHYDPATMVKLLEKEIKALKHELAMHDTLTNRSHITYDPLSEQQKQDIRDQVQKYVGGELNEVDIINIRQIQGVYEAFKGHCLQMEQIIEKRLRERYVLIDKTNKEEIAKAQQEGIPITDDGELVGEADGASFGIGQVPPGSKPAPSSVVNAKKKEYKRGKSKDKDRTSPVTKATSPAQSTKGPEGPSAPHTPSGEKQEKDREELGTPTSSAGVPVAKQPERPSTPPPRKEAFEEFKKEMGSEISRILQENKDITASKKKSYSNLAKQINYTASEIKKSRSKMDQMRQEREAEGQMYNDDGDLIISEEEYLEIKRLKDLQRTYQSDYEELKGLKSEVQYCQKLVDQCRQKLVQEFDSWYSDSFLQGQEEQPKTSADAGVGLRAGVAPTSHLEDEQEKFDRLQMELLLENPDSAAFYNAKMRTSRRKTYESAMVQPQPSMARKPGTPTRQMRTIPPTMLDIRY